MTDNIFSHADVYLTNDQDELVKVVEDGVPLTPEGVLIQSLGTADLNDMPEVKAREIWDARRKAMGIENVIDELEVMLDQPAPDPNARVTRPPDETFINAEGNIVEVWRGGPRSLPVDQRLLP